MAVELSVSDRAFLVGAETDRQGTAEPDGDQGDVDRREFGVDRRVVDGGSNETVEDGARSVALLGPIVVVEERVHDVDRAESGVDGGVQITTQRIASVRLLLERGAALGDRTIQNLRGNRPQQPLLIRKVSVERGDTDSGALGDCISGRFAPDFQDDLDRCVDDRFVIPSSVSAHRPPGGAGFDVVHKNGV